MSSQPNILVILTDQQTQRAVSAYGNPYLHTPCMDTLVHGGVSFENSYCTAPVCSPSRSSLLTGLMPHQTGVEINGPSIKPEVPTLGDVFQQGGYQSFYTGKWGLGDKRGFNFLEDEYPKGIPRQYGTNTDPIWTDQAVNFLHRFKQQEISSCQPFLLCVSLHNPHDICYWVMDNRDLVDIPADIDLPSLPPNFQPIFDEPEFIEICRQRTYYGNEMNWTNDWDEMEWRKYLYAYYRFTERVDQQIGRLLNALDENDLSDDTLVVLTSDHGEGVAAHQWVVKLMLYQEVVTVPFVIRWNGMIPENLVDRNHLVSGLDLLPTVCDYANIDLPAGLGGQSLRPLVENSSLPGRSYVVSELQPDPKHKEMEGRMIRTARFKYIIFSHGQRPELLFDLEADPGETKNLAYQVAYRDIVLEHQALLLRVIKDTLDPFPMSKQMMP